MIIRSGTSGVLARCALGLLLAAGLPTVAAAQQQRHDTSAAGPAVRNLPLTEAQRQMYVGLYNVILPQGGETSFRVYEEKGELRAVPGNQDQSRALVYQGDNVFLAGGDPQFALVFVVKNGRATNFSVHRADGVIEGYRAP